MALNVVTWMLTPTDKGTTLRMEQLGFRPDQAQFYQGAKVGWGNFFAELEQVSGAGPVRSRIQAKRARCNREAQLAR